MTTKLLSRASVWAACGLLLTVGLIPGAPPTGAPRTTVQWDERAAEEVKTALHRMHDVWNAGDIKSLKKLLVGDDVLVTFELDAATHRPIRITSRKELYDFVDSIVADADAHSGVFMLGHPMVKCRATKDLGICTEECTITVKMPGDVEEKYQLWSTAVAVRYHDGWKWIQWHMSTAGPVEVYKSGKLVWKGHKDQRPKDLVPASGKSGAAPAARPKADPGEHGHQ
jgi:hypothetical protein